MKSNRTPLALVLVTSLLLVAVPSAFAKSKKGGGNSGGSDSTPPPAANPVDKILAKYDTNHDGQLTPDEIKIFAAEDSASAQAAKGFDVNRDNVLQVSEVIAWRAGAAPAKAPAAAAPSKKTKPSA